MSARIWCVLIALQNQQRGATWPSGRGGGSGATSGSGGGPMAVPVPTAEERIVDGSTGEVEAEVVPVELDDDAASAQLLVATNGAKGGKEETPARIWWH